jgi:anti-anti-sigma regulatory factor
VSQGSDDEFRITVLTPPDTPFAFVYLEGEIDRAAFQALSDAADSFADATPVDILVDLGGVTFADVALANFLEQLSCTVPAEATVMLCRSTPATRYVLEAIGKTQVATMDDAMPCGVDS